MSYERRERETRQLIIRCQGHPNIRATHDKTWELTEDADITPHGTCFVGVSAKYDHRTAALLRGSLSIRLQVGELCDEVEAVANPMFVVGDPLIVRRNPQAQSRTFAVNANKSAAGLCRELVGALTDPNAVLEVTVKEKPCEQAVGALYVIVLDTGQGSDLTKYTERVLHSVEQIVVLDRYSVSLLTQLSLHTPAICEFPGRDAEEMGQYLQDLWQRGTRMALLLTGETQIGEVAAREVVRLAIAANAQIYPVPSNNLWQTTLAASGLAVAPYHIVGEVPRATQRRCSGLKQWITQPGTVVAYTETRLLPDVLRDLGQIAPTLPLCLSPEWSRQLFFGTASELLEQCESLSSQGITHLVLSGTPQAEHPMQGEEWLTAFCKALLKQGIPPTSIVQILRESLDWPRRRAYDFVLELKASMPEEEL